MMLWSAEVLRVNNGYSIKFIDAEGERFDVVQIDDDEDEVKGEQLAFRDLCYLLKEHFAVYNDKHANDGKGQYLTISVDGEDE